MKDETKQITPIDPVFFWDSLVEAFTERREDIAKSWNDKTADFTRLMQREVLPEVGRRMGLLVKTENCTLDCIYYADCDDEHFSSAWSVPKYFAVAVEHENNSRTSCEEMNKLQLFNTPLKVLITYVGPGRANEIEGHLSEYTKIIKSADVFQDTATLRRQLVVFGEKPKGNDFAVWRGFVYERDGFVEIV